jgi:hypothetical protein
MAEWWSIEVFDGRVSAARWKDAYGSWLIESAISNGAVDWAWHEHRWGVVFEVAFDDDRQWEVFRGLPGVRAALDAVPDPVNGLLVYRGRGGGAGASARRRPRPHAGAGAVALPEPGPDPIEEEIFEPYWIESGSMTTRLRRFPTRRRWTNPPPPLLVRPCSDLNSRVAGTGARRDGGLRHRW